MLTSSEDDLNGKRTQYIYIFSSKNTQIIHKVKYMVYLRTPAITRFTMGPCRVRTAQLMLVSSRHFFSSFFLLISLQLAAVFPDGWKTDLDNLEY